MEQGNRPTATVDSKSDSNSANVAIIAIHGVGQHISGASADAVSTLLMSIGRDTAKKETQIEASCEAAPPYSGFTVNSIEVPLRPLQAPAPPEPDKDANYRLFGPGKRRRYRSIFDERRGYLAKAREDAEYQPPGYNKKELRPNEPDRGEFAYQFMLTQVSGYEGEPDRNFQTVRLEGQRRANSSTAAVHIYDAHYSDLSKPQNNIVSFLFAFYQLLFHLASLSLQAAYWVEAENVKGENVQKDHVRTLRWRLSSSVHAISIRLLIIGVPFLNLVLLAIASSAFADKARRDWSGLPVLAIGFAALLSLGGTFLFLRKEDPARRPFQWAMIPLLGTGLGVAILSGLAYGYNRIFQIGIPLSETVLLFSWLVAAGLILGLIGRKYEPLRPGALVSAIALYLLNLFLFLLYLLPHAAGTKSVGDNQVATASLWAAQWIFGELSFTWILCLLCAFLSLPLSWFCKHGINKTDNPGRDRAARAAAAFRTGRLAFAIPAILFVIVTCVLWSGVLVYGSDKLNAFEGVPKEVAVLGPSSSNSLSIIIPKIDAVEEWLNRINPPYAEAAGPKQTVYWSNYLDGLLLVSVTPGLPITMALFALTLLLLMWAVLPSVVFEVWPERVTNSAERSRLIGNWLSRGLDNTAVLTRLLWFAIVPVPLIFFALDWLLLHRNNFWGWRGAVEHAVDNASKLTLPLITSGGLFALVSGVALSAFILKYLTVVLDTVLDIDNYLRTSPPDNTPRARIAERLVSLLRYIATYRDDKNRPYEKVIVVAHSLGSLVTTDLLRYLERSAKDSPDDGLRRCGFRAPKKVKELPIYVFSMGSPLRQLLNRFFPHLYWWVSDNPDNSRTPLTDAVHPPIPEIVVPSLPRTDEMNVALWANAYRTGDYVGRSLWIGQWLQRNPSENPKEAAEVAKPGTAKGETEQERQNNAHATLCRETCIGPGAHTHYWDRTAPDVAALLDELISLVETPEATAV